MVEQVADAVEDARDGVRAVLDPASQRVGVATQPPITLGPSGMLLAVGAAVARMRAQLRAQVADLLADLVGAMATARWSGCRRRAPCRTRGCAW